MGEDPGAVLNNKGPAHDLSSDIEELGDHPFPIAGDGQDPFQDLSQIHRVVFIPVFGHLGEVDQEKEG